MFSSNLNMTKSQPRTGHGDIPTKIKEVKLCLTINEYKRWSVSNKTLDRIVILNILRGLFIPSKVTCDRTGRTVTFVTYRKRTVT